MKKGLILCGLLTLGLAGYGCHKDNQDMNGSHGSMDSMHDNAATQPTSSADPSDAVPQSDNSAAPQADSADAPRQSESSTSSDPNTDSSANNSASATETPTSDAKPDDSASAGETPAPTDAGTQTPTEK